ncbi:MAG: hypothetical protein QOJ50_2814, partial [Cryptosporangiaceae bacterium]|nr:hypothetical protein [Cryptosporangiaceae bacterium]
MKAVATPPKATTKALPTDVMAS